MGQSGKVCGRNPGVNAAEKSDSLIVSVKPSNKTRYNRRVAEKVEKRRLAKGNSAKQNKGWTQCQMTFVK